MWNYPFLLTIDPLADAISAGNTAVIKPSAYSPATSEMGFGGVGESGMGSYHGKDGFEAFSHYKSVMDKKTWIDLPMRYQPYKSKLYNKLLHMFLK